MVTYIGTKSPSKTTDYTYSFGVSSILPNYYTKLTANNFWLAPSWARTWWASTSSNSYNPSGIYSKSYNASTGVVSGQLGWKYSKSSSVGNEAAIGFDMYAVYIE